MIRIASMARYEQTCRHSDSRQEKPTITMTDQPLSVLISGGAAGIGASIAAAYLDAGAVVHICDASAENIERFLENHPQANATHADVSKPQDVEKVYAEQKKTSRNLDILINNAGISGPVAEVEEIGVDEWTRCIDVDLNGMFYMTRLAAPRFKQQKSGCIVNIASGAALFGCPLRSPYVASKWAMVGLTKTWAMEMGPHNIRVNAICPGSVEGDRIDGVIERDAAERSVSVDSIRDVYLRQSSMRTFVNGDDISATTLFLTSPAARKISGQILAVDGHTEGLSNWLD